MSILDFYAANGGLLVSLALGHILLSVVSLAISIVLGVPLGAYVGHLHRFSFLAINGGNVLRALPTLALIAILIGVFGFGFANITIALVVLALPLILTNAYAAVEGVDPGMVEAARGMGMTETEILTRVELPNALPLIMTGIRTAWIYTVATAYLANFAGSNGTLGDVIANISGYGLSGVLAGAIVAIVIAFAGYLLLGAVDRVLTPRGLVLARAAAAAPA